MVWSGLIKLAYLPGAVVTSILFVSGLYFVGVHSSCTWVVVCVWGRVDVVMGMDVLRLSRVVVVVVVMGCGRRVTVVDALWMPWMWLWLWLGVGSSSSSVDRPWVARSHVVVAVSSSSSIDGLWVFVVIHVMKVG